jgi:hypothetical protein
LLTKRTAPAAASTSLHSTMRAAGCLGIAGRQHHGVGLGWSPRRIASASQSLTVPSGSAGRASGSD